MDTDTDTDTTLSAIRLIAERNRIARDEVESTAGDLSRILHPAIYTWHDVEPVPCGHTGGWSLDDENSEGLITDDGKVRLIHQCFYAHRYDLDHSYRTAAPIDDLVARLP